MLLSWMYHIKDVCHHLLHNFPGIERWLNRNLYLYLPVPVQVYSACVWNIFRTADSLLGCVITFLFCLPLTVAILLLSLVYRKVWGVLFGGSGWGASIWWRPLSAGREFAARVTDLLHRTFHRAKQNWRKATETVYRLWAMVGQAVRALASMVAVACWLVGLPFHVLAWLLRLANSGGPQGLAKPSKDIKSREKTKAIKQKLDDKEESQKWDVRDAATALNKNIEREM